MLNAQSFTHCSAFQANGVISWVAKYLVPNIFINIIIHELFLWESYLAKHRVGNFTLACSFWPFVFLLSIFLQKYILHSAQLILGALGNSVVDSMIRVCRFPYWTQCEKRWGDVGRGGILPLYFYILGVTAHMPFILNCLKSFCKRNSDLNNRKKKEMKRKRLETPLNGIF